MAFSEPLGPVSGRGRSERERLEAQRQLEQLVASIPKDKLIAAVRRYFAYHGYSVSEATIAEEVRTAAYALARHWLNMEWRAEVLARGGWRSRWEEERRRSLAAVLSSIAVLSIDVSSLSRLHAMIF